MTESHHIFGGAPRSCWACSSDSHAKPSRAKSPLHRINPSGCAWWTPRRKPPPPRRKKKQKKKMRQSPPPPRTQTFEQVNGQLPAWPTNRSIQQVRSGPMTLATQQCLIRRVIQRGLIIGADEHGLEVRRQFGLGRQRRRSPFTVRRQFRRFFHQRLFVRRRRRRGRRF